MIDGNTYALEQHQKRLDKVSDSLDSFMDDIDDELVELRNTIDELQARAREYDGFDFTEQLNDTLRDLI